jgi:hypothetical protein
MASADIEGPPGDVAAEGSFTSGIPTNKILFIDNYTQGILIVKRSPCLMAFICKVSFLTPFFPFQVNNYSTVFSDVNQ